MKKTTEENFEQFLKSYPRDLETDVNMTYEPPLVTFNDFTLGKYPSSVIASFCLQISDGEKNSNFMIREE